MFFGYLDNNDSGLIDYSDGEKLSVKGICKSSVYISDKNEFAIMRFEDSNNNCFKIKGNIKDMKIGCSYNIEGTVKSFNGEKQLSVYTYLECKPCNKRAIICYLQTLPGIKSKADLIYATFGDKSIDILENDPMQLTKINGIGKASVKKWAEEIKETVNKKFAILELLGYGLTQKQCMNLLKEYDTHIITSIRANPYFLVHEVKGFGFLTCDKIASQMEFKFDNPNRIANAVEYVLELATNKGHTFLPIEEAFSSSRDLLDVTLTNEELKEIQKNQYTTYHKFGKDYEIDLSNVDYCLHTGDNYYLERMDIETIQYHITNFSWPNLKKEEDRIYLKKLYWAERNLAEAIVDICYNKKQVFTREEVENVIDVICKRDNIELEEKQKEAIIQCNMYDTGVFILNGSAGTGKTFVAKFILKVSNALNYIYKRKYQTKLLPLAPTGKATKVMSNSLNMECITIHRGLQYTEQGFMRNHNNPFEENTIYIDETSMMDVELASKLFDAIHPETKVILIGDTKQLPSVGPGKVLKDLIESEIPIVITLNVVKRQGKYSGIIRNAVRVIADQMIFTEPETEDFYVIEENNIPNIQDKLLKEFYKYTKEYDISDIQVLSPQKPGPLGVNMLNFLIQRTVNPLYEGELFLKKGSFENNGKEIGIYFHLGDKVINVKNDYSLIWYEKNFGQYVPTKQQGITNGEVGIIDAIHKNENGKIEAIVKYDDDCYIKYEDASNLDLAYALTIHKSQGSQWPIVLMPISSQHSFILSNNLIYTAITRPTKKCFIVGQPFAIEKAIHTYKEESRNTTLKERLIKEWESYS